MILALTLTLSVDDDDDDDDDGDCTMWYGLIGRCDRFKEARRATSTSRPFGWTIKETTMLGDLTN